MVSYNLTLRLKGEIPFRDLAKTFAGFQKLLDTIAQEIGKGNDIEWTTGNMSGGSAEVTITGQSEDMEIVEKTIDATDVIFTNLSLSRPIPYSDYVARQARMLTNVINGKINEISIEAGKEERRITERIDDSSDIRKRYSHDTIKGKVQTLRRHRAFEFTLYDSLFGKAVNCHVTAEQEDQMRQLWGHIVFVSGLVGRDNKTGRPVDVRNIREIRAVPDVPPGTYEEAAGIFDLRDRNPEAIVRELRNTSWGFKNDR